MQTIAGFRILIVEDDLDLVDLLKLLLGKDNHIDIAFDGPEALAKVRLGIHYDLIVSDFNMPQMTGIELYNQIHLLNPMLAERIFFISGEKVDPDFMNLIKNNSSRLLAKPFGLKELRQALKHFCATI